MARLGRSYVFPQIRRNPQAPAAGPTYNDTPTGAISLSGTRVEAHSKTEGTRSGTIALSGIRSESHVHSASSSTYGDGTYGDGTYGGGILGTIPLSGAAAESFEPPGGGLLETQRRRRQYGN